MANVAGCLALAAELEVVSDTARLDVEILLAQVLDVDRSWLFTWPDHELTTAQQLQFTALFERRLRGEPVAHLVGEREFWSLPLKVNATTLIPRPDTETLVEKALQLPLPEQAQVLDLGSGAGAIALALASENPRWQVTAVDIVPEAVSLAKENARLLGLGNVEVQQSNWFDALDKQAFDLIVSNPPYIDEDDFHLRQGDVRFEPRSALVSANHGLADLQQIIFAAPDYLSPKGWLVVEHGFEQAGAVRALLKKAAFEHVETDRDLAGNDRISFGCLP